MKKQYIAYLVGILSLLIVTPALAQTTPPRPTPTNVAPGQTNSRGSISGYVYADVNGDGVCVNTGVAGEIPVEGITIQFTSSDGETVIPLQSGKNGSFGLVAAGESFWEVLAMPASGIVSSENPRFVPVYADDVLDHANINFCVSPGAVTSGVIVGAPISNLPPSAAIQNNTAVMPEAGAPARPISSNRGVFGLTAVVGLAIFLTGVGLEIQRRRG